MKSQVLKHIRTAARNVAYTFSRWKWAFFDKPLTRMSQFEFKDHTITLLGITHNFHSPIPEGHARRIELLIANHPWVFAEDITDRFLPPNWIEQWKEKNKDISRNLFSEPDENSVATNGHNYSGPERFSHLEPQRTKMAIDEMHAELQRLVKKRGEQTVVRMDYDDQKTDRLMERIRSRIFRNITPIIDGQEPIRQFLARQDRNMDELYKDMSPEHQQLIKKIRRSHVRLRSFFMASRVRQEMNRTTTGPGHVVGIVVGAAHADDLQKFLENDDLYKRFGQNALKETMRLTPNAKITIGLLEEALGIGKKMGPDTIELNKPGVIQPPEIT